VREIALSFLEKVSIAGCPGHPQVKKPADAGFWLFGPQVKVTRGAQVQPETTGCWNDLQSTTEQSMGWGRATILGTPL
jgi:hypothetical protein